MCCGVSVECGYVHRNVGTDTGKNLYVLFIVHYSLFSVKILDTGSW